MSCACGCGAEPPPGARYVLHHHLKGRVYSAETRARFRDAQLQRKGPRNSHTPETRAKTKATLDAKKAAGWRQPLKFGNVLVEVNGCWHHSCPTCGVTGLSKKVPQRDAERARWAVANGFTLVVLWEHSIRVGDFTALAEAT